MNELQLPETLRVRINSSDDEEAPKTLKRASSSFVLYLPTVVLRKKHNPSFALACRLANHHKVPLIVLAVVLDDAHMPSPSPATRPMVMTSRRLAFVLEALKDATREWEQHGAGVGIRAHGPQARKPHHLTLARNAMAVVMDEPFVDPFLSFCQSVDRATQCVGVPCYRVDGSTTVPPVSKLKPKIDAQGNVVGYEGVPAKAWMWQKKTDSVRKAHVQGVVRDGHFDAPELVVKVDPSFFLSLSHSNELHQYLPTEWQSKDTAAPGHRPWTVTELAAVEDLKKWSLLWPGADESVPPCEQTCGSSCAGQERWNTFRRNGLSSYAKLRNQIQKPHAVSRMSCYLNYGIVSLFQVIYELWQESSTTGAQKFAEEVIKWREMSYAHAFSSPGSYNRDTSVPEWSRRYLNQCRQELGQVPYTLQQLEESETECQTWNAMQRYLVRTGELHNNARMTWGKMVVHWQKSQKPVDAILQELVYLNDRYALDGLSPPSYAGILWCLGWCDKPKDGVLSEKLSSRYRVGPEGFQEAERLLLSSGTTKRGQRSISDMLPPKKKKRGGSEPATPDSSSVASTASRPSAGNTLFQYFKVQNSPNTPGKRSGSNTMS